MATTPEEKENQAIARAVQLARKTITSPFARIELEIQHGKFHKVHINQSLNRAELDAMIAADTE